MKLKIQLRIFNTVHYEQLLPTLNFYNFFQKLRKLCQRAALLSSFRFNEAKTLTLIASNCNTIEVSIQKLHFDSVSLNGS